MQSKLVRKIIISAGAFCLALVLILWEHFNGGVVTHHLLADGDLPGFSNWWGLLTLPLLTWIVLSLLSRANRSVHSGSDIEEKHGPILRRFLLAGLFGLIISILWAVQLDYILPYLILTPLLIAIFRPVHLPECLLGFVIGMMYSFGTVLPILFGLFLLLMSFIVYGVSRLMKRTFRTG